MAMTGKKYEPRVPEGVDVTRPSIARIYDYLLYGKDNFYCTLLCPTCDDQLKR